MENWSEGYVFWKIPINCYRRVAWEERLGVVRMAETPLWDVLRAESWWQSWVVLVAARNLKIV
jgi:hypothetical protein